jgi:succinyl-CoA synthetase beta subunit
MWLLPGQVHDILRECGLKEAPAGAGTTVRLTVEVEPTQGMIRVGAARACLCDLPGSRGHADSRQVPRPSSGTAFEGTTVDVDPRSGLWDNHARDLLVRAGLRDWLRGAPPIIRRLWQAFREYELLRLEAELAGTGDASSFNGGRMLCDDNALDRNKRLAGLLEPVAGEASHAMRSYGIEYVALDGEIGLLSVGAGETLATMDLLEAAGGRAACFMDCSGGFGPDAVTAAMQRVLGLPGVRVMLVNIFGGVTRVDDVAESIATALERIHGFSLPLVIRLEGNGAERGRELLNRIGLRSFMVLREAVEAAVALAKETA